MKALRLFSLSFVLVMIILLNSCRKVQTTIHCYEYSAAYDYAVDSGAEPYIIFGAKKPDFDCDEDKFEYAEKGEYFEIISYNGDGHAVYIPETHNGKTVTSIASEAFKDITVKDIYFPVTVTEINCSFSN